jgi:bacterioferritin (cytochrome b1)
MKDAQGNPEVRELLEQICEQDEEAIRQLQQQLARMLGEGAAGGGETSRRATASTRRS